MSRYLAQRLFSLIAVLFTASTLVFSLIHIIPGDPIDLILGEHAIPSDREAFRHALQLDLPLPTQYVHFLQGLFSGNLGQSLFERKPVLELLIERFPATLELAFFSMVLALVLALFLGITAAVKKGTFWDHTSMLTALLGISIPHVWLGPILILLFSITLDLLPLSGRHETFSFVLPSITLGSGMAAILTRMTRSSMLETLREDYVRTAKAKGVSESKIIFHHVLKNALPPILTIAGLQFGSLLTGAVVTEKIFGWPGIGSLLIQSIERRDYPVLQGCILLIAFTYSLVNFLTDLLQMRMDPRMRLPS